VAVSMPHQQDSAKHWQRWLEDRGVAEAVARHVNDLYRTSRRAGERVWTFAYAGATSGAVIGVLAAAIFIRWASGRWPGWPGLAIMVLAGALAASLAWWCAYWLMHRSGLRTRASRIVGRALKGGDECVEQVIGSLAEGLARSQFRPRDERSEMEQLTQATIVTGLREAPTSELSATCSSASSAVPSCPRQMAASSCSRSGRRAPAARRAPARARCDS